MINDKGFSRIISVIIVIVIVVLVGVVISINSTGDNESVDLVDIIEHKVENDDAQEEIVVNKFVGLDLFTIYDDFKLVSEGYNFISQTLGEEANIMYEKTGGKYKLLTKEFGAKKVLLIDEYVGDYENGGKHLTVLDMVSGEASMVFELPVEKDGDLARILTDAVYSSDENIIAYLVFVYDNNNIYGARAERSKFIEFWEYDINKDTHTLITQITGGLYSGMDLIGYDSQDDNLIVYRYTGDGPGISYGSTYFINLTDGVVDKIIIENDWKRFTKNKDIGLSSLGLPRLSPSGEYIAFLPPVKSMADAMDQSKSIATPVVLYNTRSHEFSDLYQYDQFKLGEEVEDWQKIYNIQWNYDKLYISTNEQVLEYNRTTTKLRPLYEWSDGDRAMYSVMAANDNGLIIKSGANGEVVYVDYLEASEHELESFQNFEYINIYEK